MIDDNGVLVKITLGSPPNYTESTLSRSVTIAKIVADAIRDLLRHCGLLKAFEHLWCAPLLHRLLRAYC